MFQGKERLRNAEFRSRAMWKDQKEWKWNYDQVRKFIIYFDFELLF
jgi:hypothetical protein